VSQDAISLLKAVFRCGNYETIEDYDANGGITIEQIKEMKWFTDDLPEGALQMKQECLEKTKEREKSTAYQELKKNLIVAAEKVGVHQTCHGLGGLMHPQATKTA
jgi:hypothetical protein